MSHRNDKPAYDVTLSLTIDDAGALWAAAAQHAMLVGGMSVAEVIETLGSVQDPQIDDCLIMLIDPARFGGCTIATMTCDARRPGSPPAIVEQHAAKVVPMRTNDAMELQATLLERFG